MAWTDTRHGTGTTCPACGHWLDASSDRKGTATPSVGDVTVCIECEVVLTYVSLSPLVFRPADVAALPSDVQVELAYIQWAIRQVHAKRGG